MNTYKSSCILAATILYAVAVQAAVEVEVFNERIIDDKSYTYSIKILYEGKKSRYTFYTGDDAKIAHGSYLISLDAGESAYFIDSEENTCHKWTNQELVKILGSYLLKTTQRFNVKVSAPKITRVSEEDSPSLHGLPIKHIRIKADLVVSYKFLLFDDTLQVERISDNWISPGIPGIETKPLYMRTWQVTGFQQADDVLDNASRYLPGYRMRTEILQTVTNKKNKKKQTKIIQYVKSIRQVENLEESLFVIPDCERIGSDQMEQRVKSLLLLIAGKPL